MKQILEKFTKVEIAKRCEVGYTTVLGWFKRKSMPTHHLPAVGCKIVDVDEIDSVEKACTVLINHFGLEADKNKIKRK